MALIYSEGESREARTHALVIGVGGYPHLQGGLKESAEALQLVGLLGQLTSPPRSAIAFANHLVETADSWQASLGTLELLITLAPDDPIPLPETVEGNPIKSATFANIQEAYMAWKARSNGNPENIAVFYFCGHGVEKFEHILLCEDFGEVAGNPWLGSFAFDSTRLAFHSCHAQTQLLFVDACRQITIDMLKSEPTRIPLEIADTTAQDCEFNLTMKAAARNRIALGPKKGVSYFVQALKLAMEGAASTQITGEWVIRTGMLHEHITDILRLVKASEGFKGRCDSQISASTAFMRLTEPKVELIIECDPEEANPVASLICELRGAPVKRRFKHDGAPWNLEVDPGIYQARSEFVNEEFLPGEAFVHAIPPEQPKKVMVRSP